MEFVAQVLQPVHGARDQSTRRALEGLAAGGALPGADAAELVRADRSYRAAQSTLRITVGRAALDRTAHEVRALFVRHVGEPG